MAYRAQNSEVFLKGASLTTLPYPIY